MKKVKKQFILGLCFTLLLSVIFSTNSPVVKAQEYSNDEFIDLHLVEDIEVLELEQSDIDLINKAIADHQANEEVGITTYATAVPGLGNFITTIKIIGVGTVVIYTGGIMIGDVIAKTGSALFNSVKSAVYPYIIGATIPKSLRKDGKTVDLGKFKDKHGNTPLKKNSGKFTNGQWTIDKDTAGHGGRKWKLKKGSDRKASLDGKGKILAD